MKDKLHQSVSDKIQGENKSALSFFLKRKLFASTSRHIPFLLGKLYSVTKKNCLLTKGESGLLLSILNDTLLGQQCTPLITHPL